MKICELFQEKINPDTVKPGFEQRKDLNDRFYLIARGRPMENAADVMGVIITAYDAETENTFEQSQGIASARLIVRTDKDSDEKFLVSSMTYTDKKYQRIGLANAIYKFARELGNDILPSSARTADGRALWAAGDPGTDPRPFPNKTPPDPARYKKWEPEPPPEKKVKPTMLQRFKQMFA